MKEKQIEEMAKDLRTLDCLQYNPKYSIECQRAMGLYALGYRKSKDVAEEIFTEIEEKVKRSIAIYVEEMNKEHIKDTPLYNRCSRIALAFQNMAGFIAELKKKYTEEGK